MKLKLALAAIIACVSAVLISTTALAHSRPVRFDPAPGAVLQSAPAKIDGWFTNELRRDPNWSFIQVADAQGSRADTGDPVLSGGRHQITANLKSGLSPGQYTVTWRTWDDTDGEIFGDCFTFFVGQAAADKAVASGSRLDGGGDCQRLEYDAGKGTPTPDQLAKAVAAAAGNSTGSSSADVPWWTLVIAGAAGLAAGAVGGRLIKTGR